MCFVPARLAGIRQEVAVNYVSSIFAQKVRKKFTSPRGAHEGRSERPGELLPRPSRPKPGGLPKPPPRLPKSRPIRRLPSEPGGPPLPDRESLFARSMPGRPPRSMLPRDAEPDPPKRSSRPPAARSPETPFDCATTRSTSSTVRKPSPFRSILVNSSSDRPLAFHS